MKLEFLKNMENLAGQKLWIRSWLIHVPKVSDRTLESVEFDSPRIFTKKYSDDAVPVGVEDEVIGLGEDHVEVLERLRKHEWVHSAECIFSTFSPLTICRFLKLVIIRYCKPSSAWKKIFMWVCNYQRLKSSELSSYDFTPKRISNW